MTRLNDILEYNGYHTRIEFDSVSKVLHGKIEGINDLVTFESSSVSEIESEFHKAVDDYLAFCSDIGQEPNKEYKGSFNIRITPELHRKLVEVSFFNDESLNSSVEKAIDLYVQNEEMKMTLIKSQNETVNVDKNI
jgi:predicted HicB family RNase H-like nuclease